MSTNKFESRCDGCGEWVAPSEGRVTGRPGALMVTHVHCVPPAARLLPLSSRASRIGPPARPRRNERHRLVRSTAVACALVLLCGLGLVLGRDANARADSPMVDTEPVGAGDPPVLVTSPSPSAPTSLGLPPTTSVIAVASAELGAVPAIEASVQTVPPAPPTEAISAEPDEVSPPTARTSEVVPTSRLPVPAPVSTERVTTTTSAAPVARQKPATKAPKGAKATKSEKDAKAEKGDDEGPHR
jgi:hypothetical protein